MSFTVWFTGIPVSGKTTLAVMLTERLAGLGHRVERMDSDEFRGFFGGLLGSSAADRDITARSMAAAARALNRSGVVAVCAACTPRVEVRRRNRKIISDYIEVYCKCDVEAARQRDDRRLYLQAEVGFIENFTGCGEPYEEAEEAEIVLDTDSRSEEECLRQVLEYLDRKGYLPAGEGER